MAGKKSKADQREATTFGQRLRELRLKNNVRQGILAEAFGISPAYLSDIERSRRNPPADATIREWARHLDLENAEEVGSELVDLAAEEGGREAVEMEVATTPAARGSRVSHRQGPPRASGETPFLDHFGHDLVARARDGELDGADERREVYDEIAVTLSRHEARSPLLCSPSSAEIHRTVHGLARALADGGAPATMKRTRLLSIEGLQAGVKYRGQLEERLRTLLTEVAALPDVVLHFHTIADLVDLERAANGTYLRPALLSGEVRILTGARPDELEYARQTDAGIVEAFTPVELTPLDRQAVLRGLHAVRPRYAGHHGVTYADEALTAIVDATEGAADGHWRRALDLLDEAGARHRLGEASGEPIRAAQVLRLREGSDPR